MRKTLLFFELRDNNFKIAFNMLFGAVIIGLETILYLKDDQNYIFKAYISRLLSLCAFLLIQTPPQVSYRMKLCIS